MKNKNLKDFAPYIAGLAALGAAAAAATIAFSRTSKAIKDLSNLDLDFGNDSGIISMFTREDDR